VRALVPRVPEHAPLAVGRWLLLASQLHEVSAAAGTNEPPPNQKQDKEGKQQPDRKIVRDVLASSLRLKNPDIEHDQNNPEGNDRVRDLPLHRLLEVLSNVHVATFYRLNSA